MSQVIVTDDRYKDKRKASGDQERKITRYAGIDRWQRSDVTKPDLISRGLGFFIAILLGPITAVGAGVFFAINMIIFRPLALLFGRRNAGQVFGNKKPD